MSETPRAVFAALLDALLEAEDLDYEVEGGDVAGADLRAEWLARFDTARSVIEPVDDEALPGTEPAK